MVENQMMCCCQSQIAIDYMKSCINPLWLVYVPAPSSPPPPPVPAPSFSYPSLITTRVHSYTWYTRVSQNNLLRQNIWHSSFFFENLSKPPFFCRFASAHFLQHLLPKMLSFFPLFNDPRIFSGFFLAPTFWWVFSIPLFSAALNPHIFTTPFAEKMHSLFSVSR